MPLGHPQEIIVAAFKKYVVSNPLHPESFPSMFTIVRRCSWTHRPALLAIRKMEAEVVSMCLRMYVLAAFPPAIKLTGLPLQVQQPHRCRHNNIRRNGVHYHVVQDPS